MKITVTKPKNNVYIKDIAAGSVVYVHGYNMYAMKLVPTGVVSLAGGQIYQHLDTETCTLVNNAELIIGD